MKSQVTLAPAAVTTCRWDGGTLDQGNYYGCQ
jgi:hypothetical protein